MVLLINHTDLNEAIKNYWYKKEGGKYYDAIKQEEIDTKEPENHWIFIRYKNRLYYDRNDCNPQEDNLTKELMIENIRRAVLEWEIRCEIHDHDQ